MAHKQPGRPARVDGGRGRPFREDPLIGLGDCFDIDFQEIPQCPGDVGIVGGRERQCQESGLHGAFDDKPKILQPYSLQIALGIVLEFEPELPVAPDQIVGDPFLERGQKEGFFAGEMTVDDGLGDPGFFGDLVLRTIGDLLFVFDLEPLWQPLFQGVILLVAVSLGALQLLKVSNRLELFK